jgi:hypothetical protein
MRKQKLYANNNTQYKVRIIYTDIMQKEITYHAKRL